MGFPSELEWEEYVEGCIGYTVGLPVCGKALKERVAQAEEGQRELREKVVYLHQRLQHTQQKLDRARAEANLNAQAVRKCVRENEKGAEQYRKLCDECTRLERECALYLHDREVFMEAADEAEERANEAEERANEAEERILQAENKIQELVSQVQHMKQGASHSTASKSKMAEELNSLRCRIRELESGNHRLENVSTMVKKHQDDCFTNHQIEQVERENRELRSLLDIATSRSEEQLNECQTSKQDAKEDYWRDRLLANSLVSSAIAKGLCKATEQEKEETIAMIYSDLDAVIKEMLSELHGRKRMTLLSNFCLRKRLEVSEKKAQVLNTEVQSLRQEKKNIKSNLEKAEIEVQLLDEENKELRLLLRGKYQGSDGCVISPLQTKVKVSCSLKSQLKPSENICDMKGNDTLRQPLTPLAQNPAESRVHHR